MSTPPDGDHPWQQPEAPRPGSGYGRPGSASYGKYGQGEALPVPPAPAPGSAPANPTGGPGGGAPGSAQSPPSQWSGNRLKPTSPGLLTAAVGLSVLLAVCMAALPVVAPNQHQAMKDAFDAAQSNADGTLPKPVTLATGSLAYRVLSPVALLVEVATWVVVGLWLTRARENALVLWPNGQRRSETWIWLGWIVPIVNFWFPWQILKDTSVATAYVAQRRAPGVTLWWFFWLGSSLLAGAQAGFSLLEPNSTRHAVLAVVGAIVTLIAVVLWLRIVRWISATQDALPRQESPTTLNG